jgi:hypothetical protein
VGFGWGAVGWVPLAPYEPLYPWWGRRFAGFLSPNVIYQNTTIIHNTNITNIYRNARVRDGVTVVRGDDFVRGQVGRPLRLGGEELARASVARGALPFAPSRESLRLADREPVVRRASAGADRAERFFSRRPVERAERIPFDEQRRSFEQLTSRSAGFDGRRDAAAVRDGVERSGLGSGIREAERSQDRRMDRTNAIEDRGWRRADEGLRNRTESWSGEANRAGTGWRSVDEPARRTETRSGESGWRRFGDPGVGARSPEANRTRTEMSTDANGRTGSGWRSFGDPSRSAGRTETPRAESPRRSFGGVDDGVRVSPAPRSESPRWSTGDSPRYEAPRAEIPRPEAPRNESPRWSTGGSRSDDGGVRVSPAPRNETPRMDTPRQERQAEPSRGGEARPSPRSERGISFAPMNRGAWSTGGGLSVAESPAAVSPRLSGEASGFGRDGGSRQSWRTGGAAVVDVSPRSVISGGTADDSWRSSGGRSTWSTGGGVADLSPRSALRSEPRSAGGWSTGGAGGRTGWAGDGFGGVRSAPFYSMPRSAPSYGGGIGGGMRSAPSYGGGMSASPGIGGGGIRSGGGMSAPPAMGGGGIRGGGFGGGARSAPSGGGGVRSGRGR